MVDSKGRNSVKFLEDIGLSMYIKEADKPAPKKPPKLRKRQITNIDYLAASGLKCLVPELCESFPSSLYDASSDCSYFEQCYVILDKLGEGSFGSVMKVVSKENNKLYALKLAKEPFRGDHDRTLKLKEVENHIKLSDHPNVVTLHDAWEEDRLLYMLLELCKNNVSKTRKLSEDDCWNILIDTTLALDELHVNGMGHFDVKPENILCGYDGFYKLSDFGLTFNIKTPNRKHPIEGDAKYLPPELLLANHQFTEKADIFSLGISILELAGNLVLPSHGEVWKALRENMFPRNQTKHISDDLFLLLTRMMASEWSARPSTKEILNFPKVKAVLQQRHSCRQLIGQPFLSLLNDKLQQFLFVWATFYVLVHLVSECLLTQEFTQESMELEKCTRPEKPNKFEFFTSTPMQSETISILEHVNESGYWRSMDRAIVQSTSESGSPLSVQQLMACELSPIRLSREIKQAIRSRRSVKMTRYWKRKRRCQDMARRVLFSNNNDGEDEIDDKTSRCDISNKPQDTSIAFKELMKVV